VTGKANVTRVLIVGPSHDILGGQSVQAARLLARLRDEGSLEVGFLPINPRLPGALRKLQLIKYVRTLVTSIVYVLSLLTRAHRYDVLHVFSASYFSFVLAPTPAILIGKLYGRKVLLNYHSGEADDHLRRWSRTAIPTIRMVDSVIVPSEYLVRVFANYGLRARAIFNLIDTGKFHFRKRMPLKPIFLANRNLEPHYGVDRVLRAFAIIQGEFAEAKLTVVGDGTQRVRLERLARELNLKNTTFVGQVDPEEIVAQYDAADLYLNGSEIDNQPLSILEAFACGLPIITTNAGGIPDIVSDGETGSVVSRGDYQAMAQRAITLLKNPERARQMSTRGHEECGKYSWEAVREQWLNAYTDLANSRRVKNSEVKVASEPSREEENVITR
jgi:L-malate glycosyltransferase